MQPGEVVAGRFEIERLAGQGGMGAVYRALDRTTGEHVALKTLLESAVSVGARFEREATLLAELRHPAIVRYVAHGRLADGAPWLAMEWLEGEDLQQRLANEGVTLREAVAIVTRAAEGLAVAHARGIVHRDIKPANLYLPEGRIDRLKVLDFGVARQGVASPGVASEATRTGVVIGTPAYMAPEQARGAKDVGARADVFALGCVLFACLTGRRPFEGNDPLAVLAKVLFEDAPRVSSLRDDVPRALDDLVHRMLAKDPAARPADGAEVASALGALDAQGPAATAVAVPVMKTPSPHTAVSVAEQRIVSVVLVGTETRSEDPLAATMAAQDSNTRLRVEEAARPFGAKVEVLVDGSIVCALSAHGSAIDQATQASRAALAIRAKVPELPIALATGRGSFAGQIPLGEAIDRAVALLRGPLSTTPHSIVLDSMTAGLLDARFTVEPHPEGQLLRGEHETEAGRSVLGKPTPCVGRDRELATLEALFLECATEPIARVMLVTAPAGVGKSRLRAELLSRIARRAEIWSSRGDGMSAGSPFSLLAPAIRRAAGILEGEPLEVRRHKLAERVAHHVKPADKERVTEFLCELAGAPSPDEGSVQLRAARKSPMLMGDQMRRAFVDWLDAETRSEPVVLVFDDLHVGDLPSIQFVDAAMRALHDRPLLVLAFARPEVHDRFPGAFSERGVQELRLGELTRKSSERLVRAVLGEAIGDDTVARVVDRAQGNAFFLEELMRAVADGKGERFPDTVLAMVQSRLERLPAEARRVLRAASVFGETFWRNGVQALLGEGASDEELDPWLEDLVRRELVVTRDDGKFPGEMQFRQNLLREAAYGMLTQEDLLVAHSLAGDWLAANGETDAIVLAEHFERSKTPSRAVRWFRTAAEQALEGNDLAAVIERAERGIACGAEGKVRGALRALQAEAHGWRGESAEVIERGEEGIGLLPPESAEWCTAFARVCEGSYRAGKHERLSELLAELRRAPGVDQAHVTTLARIAITLLIGGLYDMAEQLFALMERIETRIGKADEALRGVTHNARAFRAVFLTKELERGMQLFDASAKSYGIAGDVRNGSRAEVLSACVRVQLGDFAGAVPIFRHAIGESERAGLPAVRALAHSYLCLALARQGELDEAKRVGDEAVRACDALNDRLMAAPARCHLAVARTLAGDLEGALSAASEAVAVSTGTPRLRGRALATQAMVLETAGKAAEALPLAREAFALHEKLRGFGEGDALCRLAYAEALHATGDLTNAGAAIQAARAEIEAIAAKISDPALRRAFLEQVPENARTLELARAW